MRIVGEFAGAVIGLEQRDGHQVIVFSVPLHLADTAEYRAVRGLANALSLGHLIIDAIGHPDVHIEIPHTDDVDRRLLALSDLIAEIRWSNPEYVQLEMVIPEMEEETMLA
ncbi:MAG: hypothetical protein JXA14_26230 [Anaerolineae bacterium]|nr:hypothetical protein [Anaerolineae bacterium]